jgi:hypothetical protein
MNIKNLCEEKKVPDFRIEGLWIEELRIDDL